MAVTRVLMKLDDGEIVPPPPQTLAQVVAAQPAKAERVELPPLDFVTGAPVAVAAVTVADPQLESARIEKAARVLERVATLDDPVRQRVRDRYVAARFPGVAR